MRENVLQARAADGYALHYRSWQAGPGDTLVVTLHGVLTHSGWFAELGDALLERGIHVIGHDRRGSGLNLVDRGDVDSPQRLLDDLAAVVEPHRAAYRRIVYLGWCLGTTVALRYLLEKPHMGEALILMSPDIFERHVTDRVRRAFAGPEWDDRTRPRLTVPIPLEVYTETAGLETFIRPDTLKLKDFTPRFMRASMRLKEDLEAGFQAFHKPSMLILAARDQIIDNPRTIELYSRMGSEQREVVSLDCNHGVMFEALDALVATIARFVETLTRREAA
jgi:alpha-beta hydrolase superfamily lysophospholipase